MHSYIQDTGVIDWTNYGFQFDSEVDSFIPIIFTKDPKQKNNSSISKVKEHSKRKTLAQCSILKDALNKSNIVKGRDLDILVEITGLKRKSIVNWLSVQRKKIDKENEPPRKKTCI